MYDRSLLSTLCRCAWKVLSLYLHPSGTSDVRLRSLLWLTQGVSLDDPKPGAVIAVQTFGDFLNFNPHLHIIASDGCFATDGGFMVGTEPDASSLIDLFRGEVFKMLKKAGKIDDHIIENMLSWHHSGFNVYCGPAINPGDQQHYW
mgnify:CR=1 FL=1